MQKERKRERERERHLLLRKKRMKVQLVLCSFHFTRVVHLAKSTLGLPYDSSSRKSKKETRTNEAMSEKTARERESTKARYMK